MDRTTCHAAFLVTPHVGGTFSVFRNLRHALLPHKISLEWAGFSRDPDAIAREPQFAAELSRGHLIDARGLSETQAGAALTARLIQQNFDVVFANVVASLPEMSVAAYLPPEMLRIMIVHNITPGTFTCAKKVGPYVHAAVGVCPRIQEHLVNVLHFSPDRALCVPNALDAAPFDPPQRIPFGTPLRLLSLGRIIDTDKGVFWLADILHHLKNIPVQLTVAGDGPDLPALRKKLAPCESRVKFLGRVASADVPALMAAHHAFVMTSRFEGLPYTLMEAMAGGCVPVASRIRGVTDYVVREGETGLLFPIGDTAAAAALIRTLAADEALHARMSAAARADVRSRFSIDSLGTGYAVVIDAISRATPPTATRFGQEFRVLRFGRHLQQMLPERLKNFLRTRLYK